MTTPPAGTYPASMGGLTAALAALGSTAGQVADRLTAAGRQGCREDCNRCPVATYLLAVIPDATEVHVGQDFASIWNWPAVRRSRVLLPAPVAQFVTEFDSGHYSHLDSEIAEGLKP
jgi:hypothetical protein